MNHITFRKAQPRELNVVLDLLKDAAHWLHDRNIDYWQNWHEPHEGHLAWIQEGFDRDEFYLVEQHKKTIGCFRLQWQDPMFWGDRPDDAGYIHSFTIQRNLAGQHIGRHVLDMIATHCRELGKTYLRLDCGTDISKLCDYYESCGFNNVGEVTVYGERLVLYEKKIRKTIPVM